jgi:hypothetical protein
MRSTSRARRTAPRSADRRRRRARPGLARVPPPSPSPPGRPHTGTPSARDRRRRRATEPQSRSRRRDGRNDAGPRRQPRDLLGGRVVEPDRQPRQVRLGGVDAGPQHPRAKRTGVGEGRVDRGERHGEDDHVSEPSGLGVGADVRAGVPRRRPAPEHDRMSRPLKTRAERRSEASGPDDPELHRSLPPVTVRASVHPAACSPVREVRRAAGRRSCEAASP